MEEREAAKKRGCDLSWIGTVWRVVRVTYIYTTGGFRGVQRGQILHAKRGKDGGKARLRRNAENALFPR